MLISKLFNLRFPVRIKSTGVTEGLPQGVLWDNNTFYIEEENGKFVVYQEGHFDLTTEDTLVDAIKWAERRTATMEGDYHV